MSETESYHAARRASALIDLSSRGKIAVVGADRVSYLQGLLTNDIAALQPGHGCYAAYLTPQGRMMADMQVLDLGEALLLDVHPSVTTMLVDRLREFVFTEEVTVEDRTASWAALGIHGPDAARVVSAVVRRRDADGDALDEHALAGGSEYEHVTGRFEGEVIVVMRCHDLGEAGFTLYGAAAVAPALGEALTRAGAVALDGATFDLLRLEAGRPVFPTDMNEETIPLEAGIEDRALSLTKGCYVGQEVIIRILHRGHGRVARRLVGLSFAPGETPPAAGSTLTALVTPTDDAPDATAAAHGPSVGSITSSATSPALGQPIALGYVKRELAEPGTVLVAQDGDHCLSAVVTARPFLPLPTAGSA